MKPIDIRMGSGRISPWNIAALFFFRIAMNLAAFLALRGISSWPAFMGAAFVFTFAIPYLEVVPLARAFRRLGIVQSIPGRSESSAASPEEPPTL